MLLSVIVSTFNSPDWLEKVLWGLEFQSEKDFELLVADDGSSSETAELLERWKNRLAKPLLHVWHEDQGFRKCEILNRALLRASGDYIVLLDGDCVPRKDFLSAHLRASAPGHFLTGGFVRLPMNLSQRIGRNDIQSGRCFDFTWLQENGLVNDKKSRRLSAVEPWAGWRDRLSLAPKSLKGGNSSFWRADACRVGGFDHRMPWGGEDREFGVRLRNAGVVPKHVRYRAVILHLDHARGYVDSDAVKRNRALRIHSEKHRITKTSHGIELLK